MNERERERKRMSKLENERQTERENGKKEDSKCKCIDTCENCKFGINNGTANGVGRRAIPENNRESGLGYVIPWKTKKKKKKKTPLVVNENIQEEYRGCLMNKGRSRFSKSVLKLFRRLMERDQLSLGKERKSSYARIGTGPLELSKETST